MPAPFIVGGGLMYYLGKAGGFLGGAQMGLGYTSGAYAGYGISNTWDPFNLHKKGFNSPAIIP